MSYVTHGLRRADVKYLLQYHKYQRLYLKPDLLHNLFGVYLIMDTDDYCYKTVFICHRQPLITYKCKKLNSLKLSVRTTW